MQPPNIYIVGAQSTGKTTLTLALVERIQRDQNAGRQTSIPTPAVITEVARRVMEKHGFETQETFASADRVTHLQQLILDAQLQEQRQVQQGTWFISDRSGLDPLVYAHLHVGPSAAAALADSTTWTALQSSMQRAAVFVCEPNVEWIVADGFRYMPSVQETEEYFKRIHDCFREKAKSVGIDVVVVPASLTEIEQRVELVLEEWRRRWREGS